MNSGMKFSELNIVNKILRVLIFSLIFLVFSVILYDFFMNLDETLTSGSKYGFVIGENKQQVLNRVKKLRSEKQINDFQPWTIPPSFSVEEGKEICANFDRWEIDYRETTYSPTLGTRYENITKYEVIFERNTVKKISTDRFEEYCFADHAVKLGMSKEEVVNYLAGVKYTVWISFLDLIGISDNLINFSEDKWDIGYDEGFAVDYLELYFEDNKLVKMKRDRRVVEVM